MKDESSEVHEDPIVMYLIVNETLNMSIGKTAAQTAHASQYLMMQYMDLKDESRALLKQMSSAVNDPALVEIIKSQYSNMGRKISIMGEWMKVGVRKVVLKADLKEWRKIKEAYPECALVVDAGLTEIASGSETVIGLWPMRRSHANRIIARLQVLK